MTAKLYPIQPMKLAETPASYVSRLAQLHSTEARFFCLDMGFTQRQVANGNPHVLETIADLTGTSLSLLQRNAMVKLDGPTRTFRFRQERIMGHFLRRQSVQVCPCCLVEDIAESPAKPELAAYARTSWQFTSIRVCPVHRTELIEANYAGNALSYDFATLIKPKFDNMKRLAESVPTRAPSELELYLIDRIDNGNEGMHWLDQFQIHIAAWLTEVVGAVALFGSSVRTKAFSPRQWADCAAAGFPHVKNGQTFETFLQRIHDLSARNFGGHALPQATLGRFFKWLYENADTSFEPVKRIVFDFAVRTFPLAAGHRIFGHDVEQRLTHSIHTASREYGIHPKRLRKILTVLHVIPDAKAQLPNNQITFDAKEIDPILKKIATALTAVEVQDYLNCGRVQAKLLIQQGFIAPFVGRTSRDCGLGELLFGKDDLDTFLSDLLLDTVQIQSTPENCFSIQDAAKRANCSAAEIVRLILDRKLGWIGKVEAVHGFAALVVDIEEIKQSVHASPLTGLTKRDIAKMLRVADKVAAALIKEGIFSRTTVRNPVNRCPVQVVRAADVEEFGRKYVSLFELASAASRYFGHISRELNDARIFPVFDPEKIHARFYDRAMAAAFLSTKQA